MSVDNSFTATGPDQVGFLTISNSLNHAGWLFYVNLMYYFMPNVGKEWISDTIDKQEQKGRRCGSTELSELMQFTLGV